MWSNLREKLAEEKAVDDYNAVARLNGLKHAKLHDGGGGVLKLVKVVNDGDDVRRGFTHEIREEGNNMLLIGSDKVRTKRTGRFDCGLPKRRLTTHEEE